MARSSSSVAVPSRTTQLDGDGPTDPETVARRSRPKAWLDSTWLMAGVVAVVCGVLVNWGNQGVAALTRGGYVAGASDLFVLSPAGMQWADPTRFVGDFFTDYAPQPHWFFDIVTFVGGALGQLATVYFVYWLIGLVFFGFATAILAKAWARGYAWVAALAFTFIMCVAPWDVVGTGSTMIAAPIPAVVGGNAAYLFLAALLTGRRALSAVFAVVVAVLHVQQGLVVTIILAVVVLADAIATKRIDVVRAVGAAAAAGVVAFGLFRNSFGAAIADFVQVCDRMIPYHCAAHLWSWDTVMYSLALIVLAAFSVRLVARNLRRTWTLSVGLASAGLLLGLLADVWRIPVFGELAQGSNVYRLGATLLPFAVWGLLAFVLRPARAWKHLPILLVWAVVVWIYLGAPNWQIAGGHGPRNTVLLALAVAVAALPLLLPRVADRIGGRAPERRFAAIGTAGFALVFVAQAVFGSFITPRPLDISFVPNAEIREWGASAEQVIPPGEVVLHAPNAPYIRLATARGNIGDCKSVPYGGTPWEMWNERMNDLGGWRQCVTPFPAEPFNSLTPAELDDVAQKYGLEYMILEEGQLDALEGLEDLGWTVVLEPVNEFQNFVLRKDGPS